PTADEAAFGVAAGDLHRVLGLDSGVERRHQMYTAVDELETLPVLDDLKVVRVVGYAVLCRGAVPEAGRYGLGAVHRQRTHRRGTGAGPAPAGEQEELPRCGGKGDLLAGRVASGAGRWAGDGGAGHRTAARRCDIEQG